MSEPKSCPQCGTSWALGSPGHIPGDAVCLVAKAERERDEAEAKDTRLEKSLADWQEHIDTGPHDGCKCAYCKKCREAERLRGMLSEVATWINAECARGPEQEPIGYVVVGCRGVAERIGEILGDVPGCKLSACLDALRARLGEDGGGQ